MVKVNNLKTTSLQLPVSTTTQKMCTPEKKENKHTTTKVIMGGLGALASIGLAAIAMKKGSSAKVIKELNINEFKKAGKFVKGEALGTNGERVTADIVNITKDGKKHIMRYRDGVLQEVETFVPTKPINGEVSYLKSGKKVYKRNDNGKLETIDHYSYGHVSSLNPREGGFQYIKTKTSNLDKMRAEGIENYSKKQIQAAKQKLIEKTVAKTREKLTRKTEVSAEGIDKNFNNYNSGNKQLEEMRQFYEELEQKEASLKKEVKALGDKLSQKTKVSADSIDKTTENTELKDLNKQYRELEEKLAWKKSHPEEAKKLDKARKAERKASKRAEELAERQEQLAKNGSIESNIKINDPSFVSHPQDGTMIEQFHENGELKRRIVRFHDGEHIIRQRDGIKTSEIRRHDDSFDSSFTRKISKLGSDGKYHEIERETRTYQNEVVKRVKALENGNKQITVIEADKTVITVRDKKGNIVSERTIRTDKGPSDPPPSSKGDDKKIEIFIKPRKDYLESVSELLRKNDVAKIEYIELMEKYADGLISEAAMKEELCNIIDKYSVSTIDYISSLVTKHLYN